MAATHSHLCGRPADSDGWASAEGEVLVSIVVDTNVFMERLALLGRLRDNLRVLARRLQQRVALVPRLVVPSVVLLELDNFKDPHKARGEQQLQQASRGHSLGGCRAPSSAAVHPRQPGTWLAGQGCRLAHQSQVRACRSRAPC